MSWHFVGKTECCGVHVLCGPDCDGAREANCRDCGQETCSACAAQYDEDGEYVNGYPRAIVHATCVDCVMADAGVLPF